MSTVRILHMLSIVCAAGIATYSINATYAQSGGLVANQPSGLVAVGHSSVLQKARVARNNEPPAVEAFVNEIFTRSLLYRVAPSIKERVLRNELAFRSGNQFRVYEDVLVTAVNDQVRTFGLPAHMRLTRGQLRMAREDLRYQINQFRPIGAPPADMFEGLSPAETVFVALDLTTQKLFNPEYRLGPEEWERSAAERRARIGDRNQASDRGAGQPSFSASAQLVRLSLPGNSLPDFADEAAVAVHQLHIFLDRIGFQP